MGTQHYQSMRTGELLVKEGLISQEDLATALTIQEKRKSSAVTEKSRHLGMILCDLNLITPIENYVILHNNNKLITLSKALVEKRMISLEQMQSLEAQSLREDLPLISLLLKTSRVSMPVMQQLLFELFHIPFRSISDFVFNIDDRITLTGIMNRQMSMENGIIPMVCKDETILFGLTAPENLLLVHQLSQKFPQYRFKVIFIPYSGFSWFHDIIYTSGNDENEATPKQPDLTYLLKTRILISDPVKDTSLISNFYHQYEAIRTLLGYSDAGDRKNEFIQFIDQAFRRIERNSHFFHTTATRDDINPHIVLDHDLIECG